MRSAQLDRFQLGVLTLALLMTSLTCNQAVPKPKATAENSEDFYMWAQIGPSGFIARVITSTEHCPNIILDDKTIEMTPRGTTSNQFPITVCETPIPAGTTSASILGRQLPVPQDGSSVAVMGDSGCRIEIEDNKVKTQNCNDATQWPLSTVADNIAKANPDLVIHTGDYVYRQSPCPPGNADCTHSPYGDYWPAWKADFFAPLGPLLSQAPWLFTRGNHETCDRNDEGWFRLLDPRPFSASCSDVTDPYTVSYAGLNLVMLDNASAAETADSVDATSEAIFEKQFRSIGQLLQQRGWTQSWLVTHQPIWGIKPHNKKSGEQTIGLFNSTLQSAFDTVKPMGIQFVLSGHIHFFQLLGFTDDLPAQMIVGHSGTLLEPPVTTSDPIQFADRQGLSNTTASQFGHVLITPSETSANAFSMQLFDLNNSVSQTFTLCKNQLIKPNDPCIL